MKTYDSTEAYKVLIGALYKNSEHFNENMFKEFIYHYVYSDDSASSRLKSKYWNSFGLWKLVDKLPLPTNKVSFYSIINTTLPHRQPINLSFKEQSENNGQSTFDSNDHLVIPSYSYPIVNNEWYAFTDVVTKYNVLCEVMLLYIVGQYYPIKRLTDYVKFWEGLLNLKQFEKLISINQVSQSLYVLYYPSNILNMEITNLKNVVPVYNPTGQFETLLFFNKLNSNYEIELTLSLGEFTKVIRK